MFLSVPTVTYKIPPTHFKDEFGAFNAPGNRHFLAHFVGEQERNAYRSNVILRAQFQNVSNGEDGKVARAHVAVAHWRVTCEVCISSDARRITSR